MSSGSGSGTKVYPYAIKAYGNKILTTDINENIKAEIDIKDVLEHKHIFHVSEKWELTGAIDVNSILLPIRISKAAAQSISLDSIDCKINSGTNVVFTLKKNNSPILTYSNITAATSWHEVSSSVNLDDDDELSCSIVSVEGNPAGLSIILNLKSTVV